MRRVLTIVLNFNKKDMVLECLESLMSQAYAACTVVVFDNGSNDGSQAAIAERFPAVDLVCSSENIGAIGGRNAAVAYAKKKYEFDRIMFLDDDAETTSTGILRLAERLEQTPDIGVVCGKTFVSRDSNTIMSAGIQLHFGLGQCFDRGAGEEDVGKFDVSERVDACGAFAFMIRRQLFEDLGGFDPVFTPYGWEDVDLCLRAKSRGYLTFYVHDAEFVHKGTRLGRKPVLGYERNKAKNFLILLFRHANLLQKISAAIFVPFRGLILFARFAMQGNWRAIPAQLCGVKDFVKPRDKRGGKS